MLRFYIRMDWFSGIKLENCNLFYRLNKGDHLRLLSHEYIGRKRKIEEALIFSYQKETTDKIKLEHGTTNFHFEINKAGKAYQIKMELVVLEKLISGTCHAFGPPIDDLDFHELLSIFGISIGNEYQTYLLSKGKQELGSSKYDSTSPDGQSGAVMVISLTKLVPRALNWITLSPNDHFV
ncbi:hypothetical protein [Mangrovibacillus cuniculi]|uniref:Uncharacterized protein n=1 Tax=Mangrovibacillus cuniculi TaxID=2593652 RepID=A0A7S8CD68_9BACI|nr:hypothetical protein [Mangrovibacillus cuniculi]QPC47681.1 hypothetical protein G8O30_12305 [Mangrovibacillus cuniculi]